MPDAMELRKSLSLLAQQEGVLVCAEYDKLLYYVSCCCVCAAGQQLQHASTIFVFKGSLRLHSSSSSTKSSGTAAGKPTESPGRRGLFRGRSQRNAPSTAGAAGSAGAADVKDVGSSSRLRQFSAPALLPWGPELFGSLEDR
jgi:hypothetical protein